MNAVSFIDLEVLMLDETLFGEMRKLENESVMIMFSLK